ncbi:MAG TPA: adenylate kinase [Solirubrobacteraceae bacterium]|nr:adenylate kinase [Solirubrobacteraceae bacterium]
MSELNLILIGPPGAGKGTQAENLQADFGLPYIATGDMMRAKRQEDSELGREIARVIAAGELVPDDVVCKVLLERVDAEGDDGFLLDGFPRTERQADVLDQALERRGRKLTAVLLIEAADDVIIQRLAGRRVCSNGHVYHVDFNRPKHEGVCDIDGTKLVQRDDDKPETIEKRLAVYHDETEPLVARYEEAGLLRSFDGTRPPEEVHRHIRATLAVLRLEEDL